MSFFETIGHGFKKAGSVVGHAAVATGKAAVIVGEVAAPIAVPILTHGVVSREQVIEVLEGTEHLNSKNWLQYLMRALASVPLIVAGIEQIHGSEMKGADKRQLALESLGLAGLVAPAMDPAHADAIVAAVAVAGQAIDGTVAVMNAANGKPPKDAAPAIAALAPAL